MKLMRHFSIQKKAFSLIEVIFAILLISIISSVAISKFGNFISISDKAMIKSDVAIIQSSIISKSNILAMSGEDMLDTLELLNNDKLFSAILKIPFDTKSKNAKWSKQSDDTYFVEYKKTKIKFIYNKIKLTFLCDISKQEICKKLL
jgi:prepilin-type N-terminal cleavage/methylation domain-containing protein